MRSYVKGRAAAVVRSADAYQKLLDSAARTEVTEGVRQGLEQAKRGDSRDIDDFFTDFEDSHDISG